MAMNNGGAATLTPARTWIFHANPKVYDINGALQKLKEIDLVVTPHKAEVQPGDRVFVWRGGDDAGIVADGKVIATPAGSWPWEKEKEFVLDLKIGSGNRAACQGVRRASACTLPPSAGP